MNNTMVLLLENHFEEIRSKVISYGRKNGHSSPEDLFCETVYDSLKYGKSFEGSLSNFISYLLQVAHSKLVDYYQSSYNKNTYLVDNFYDNTNIYYYDNYFLNQDIYNLNKYLNSKEYLSIICKYIYQLDDSTSCSLLQVTPVNLRVIRNRAYSKLKKVYK